MKRILIIMMLLLAGCGQPTDHERNVASNYGYGWDYDAQSTSGLRVRYYDDTSPRIEEIEHEFERTLACVLYYYPAFTANIPRPLFIFVSVTLTDTQDGLAYLPTNTIVINQRDASREYMKVVIRHESAHMIIHHNGFDPDENYNHASPVFDNFADGEGCILERPYGRIF